MYGSWVGALKIFIIFLRFLGTVLMAYFDVFEVFYIQKWFYSYTQALPDGRIVLASSCRCRLMCGESGDSSF
jgi:hypothetical protein